MSRTPKTWILGDHHHMGLRGRPSGSPTGMYKLSRASPGPHRLTSGTGSSPSKKHLLRAVRIGYTHLVPGRLAQPESVRRLAPCVGMATPSPHREDPCPGSFLSSRGDRCSGPVGWGTCRNPTRTGGPAEASGGKSEGDELGESLQGGDGNPGAGTGHMKTLL